MANEFHEDGLWFGMDESEYHQDPALGSSSLKKLASNPAAFWWDSPMNPDRPADKDTSASVEGTATHTIVLEGVVKFRDRYLCGKNQEGMSSADKTASTKESNKEAAAQGKIHLKYDVYHRLLKADEAIRRNEHLSKAFSHGEPEVSVFWTRPGGVRLKARIDYLKVKAIGDLKTIANERELPMERACRNAIATYQYLVQAASYLEGRSLFPQLVAEKRVYGDHDPDWLARVAAEEDFRFQWVFIAKSGAPLTHSDYISQPSDLLVRERAKVDLAVHNYQKFMQEYGPDRPWVEPTAPRELAVEDLPRWYDFT